MAHGIADGIDLVVAQGSRLFGGAQFRRQRKVVHAHTHGFQDDLERAARSGTGVADVHALARQVGKGLDAAVGAGHDGEGLGVDGEHGAKVGEGIALIVRAAVIGVELPVGLGHAHRHAAGPDLVDVVDGSTGRGRGAAQAGGRRVAVHQAADRLTHDVIDARLAAGADGDELFFLRHQRRGTQCHGGAQQDRFQFTHVGVSLTMIGGKA